MDFATIVDAHFPHPMEPVASTYCINDRSGVGADFLEHYRATHKPRNAAQSKACRAASINGGQSRWGCIRKWEQEMAKTGILTVTMARQITGMTDDAIRRAIWDGAVKAKRTPGPKGKGLYYTMTEDQLPALVAYKPAPRRSPCRASSHG